jgi:uncharacterized protein YcfL
MGQIRKEHRMVRGSVLFILLAGLLVGCQSNQKSVLDVIDEFEMNQDAAIDAVNADLASEQNKETKNDSD